MNSVNLLGRITRDLELRKTANGVSYVFFTLAVNRPVARDQEGQKADFIPCSAWRITAETMAKYLSKGSQIAVSGSLRTRSTVDQTGQNRTIMEVMVDRFDFAESGRNNSQLGDYQSKESFQVSQPKPYVAKQTTTEDSFNNSYNDDISDDDLPF